MLVDEQDYLEHFGVKGMKWYQHLFGKEDTRAKYRDYIWTPTKHGQVNLKAGTEVQRIQKTDKFNTPGNHAYVSVGDINNLEYVTEAGHDGFYWTGNYNPDPSKDNYGYKIKLKVTKDVVAPSFKESVDIFLDTMKDKTPEQIMKKIYGDNKDGYYLKDTWEAKKEIVKRFVNDKTIEDYTNSVLVDYVATMNRNEENRREFFSKLEQKGYNAVVDYNDIKTSGYATSNDIPLIMLDKNQLKQLSSEPITQDMQDEAWMKLYKFQEELDKKQQR